MADCVFCKIAKEEISSVKIYEDELVIAILDLYPNMKGQTLVLPKKHVTSDLFEVEDAFYQKFLLRVKKVAGLLKTGLCAKRVCMIFEGMEVDHLHAKLYPILDIEKMVCDEEIDLNKYKGFLSTKHGKKASLEELERVKKEITKK